MAAEEFKIEVPLNFSGSGKNKDSDKLEKAITKLDKTVYGTIDVLEMVSSLLGDVYKLFQPLIKILSTLFLIIFLPLMPLIKGLMEKLSGVVKFLAGSGFIEKGQELFSKLSDASEAFTQKVKEGLENIGQGLKTAWSLISNAGQWLWENVIKPGFSFLGNIGETIWNDFLKPGFGFLADVGSWIWGEIIQPAFNFLINVGSWIWEQIIQPAFNFLSNVGETIWTDILKPAFEWLSDVGTKIWEILKSPFNWLANKIRNLKIFGGGSTSVQDAIIKPSGEIIKTSPNDYIFTTKTPEKMMSGGTNNITLNMNASVRNDSDIKKIATEVSKLIERKLWRSY